MQHDGRVLSRLDHLVEIADGALPHGPRQWSVHPLGLATTQQKPPDEVGRRQIVMAGDGDQRAFEVVRHRLDESRLAATGRSLEHDRQPPPKGGFEHVLLVADRHVERSDLAVSHHFLSLTAKLVGAPQPTEAPRETAVR